MALLTRMSTVPYASSVAATQRSMSSLTATSAPMASASPPWSAISRCTASTLARVRPTSTTREPDAASAAAIPRPTPWPAPVTMATLPSSSAVATLIKIRSPVPRPVGCPRTRGVPARPRRPSGWH